MNGSKKTNRTALVLSVITFALCLFLALGVMLIFHACVPKDDGTWMSCHYAQLSVFAFGIVMSVLSLIAMILQFSGQNPEQKAIPSPQETTKPHVSRQKAAAVLYVLVMICAVISAVIPQNVIHLCMMPEMRCRAVMRPVTILLDVLIIIFAAGCLLSTVAGRNNRRLNRT